MSKPVVRRELSACETLIMKIVWDSKEDIAVQELIVQLRQQYDKDYARTTVVTFLKKMVDKGFVRTYRVGNASFVHAERDEEEYMEQLMGDENEFWFGGRPSKLMSALFNGKKVSKEEVQRMRELLDNLEE